MSSNSDTALYIGVTDNLEARVREHRSGEGSVFTGKYQCHKLVYFEEYSDINQAIEREKQLKKWRRELVNSMNPDWNDLSENIGLTEEYIEGIKEHYRMERGG